MFECETCTEQFYWQDECEDHMSDAGHWPECESCSKCFSTQRACNRHMNKAKHWAPWFPCQTCNLEFETERAAQLHMEAKGHFEDYCRDCKRQFSSKSNLRAHLNSRTHRGYQVKCPFCKNDYVSASGLAHHLETGSCVSAPTLNRETILNVVRAKDPHGFITNKQISWYKDTHVMLTATDRAWNGRSWECPRCDRRFKSRTALDKHLNSPVHKPKVYHCPNGRCGKEFTALAGLFGHLESGTCAFMRFEKVQEQAGGVVSGRKMLTFG